MGAGPGSEPVGAGSADAAPIRDGLGHAGLMCGGRPPGGPARGGAPKAAGRR